MAAKKDTKLLILGGGETGKSTFFKQMMFNQREPSHHDAIPYLPVLHNNIISFMVYFGEIVFKQEGLSPNLRAHLDTLMTSSELTPALLPAIKELWEYGPIQEAFKNRGPLRLQGWVQMPYFMAPEILDQICRPGYVPTREQIMRTTVRTTGFIECSVQLDDWKLEMCDTGGQRNERKKWIHAFPHTQGLVFCSAIGRFDEVLFEDETMLRLEEDLRIWETLVNMDEFQCVPILLLFTHRDIFHVKYPISLPALAKVMSNICPCILPPLIGIVYSYLQSPINFAKCLGLSALPSTTQDPFEIIREQFFNRVHGAADRIHDVLIDTTNSGECAEALRQFRRKFYQCRMNGAVSPEVCRSVPTWFGKFKARFGHGPNGRASPDSDPRDSNHESPEKPL